MQNSRIFIVADEEVVSMNIENRLLSLGYRLAGHAKYSEQALQLIQEKHPELVLMDCGLQGAMDGIAAAAEFRRCFHIPVILLIDYSEDETLERAKLTEPDGYLLKPFNDRELKFAIEMALYKYRAEGKIRRLNRLYDVLSQINQTIVRVKSQEELLDTVCRIMGERGEIDMAWIGWQEPETFRFIPVASYGKQTAMSEIVYFFADEYPEGKGNPARAIREGKAFICNHCVRDNCFYPKDTAPKRFGCQSCGSFPLISQDQVCGVLSICVAEPGFFGEREINLLEEVTLEISFALDKLESDAQLSANAKQLQQQAAFLDNLLQRQIRLNQLQQALLVAGEMEQKLKMITDGVVDIFKADFCRIWTIGPGDLCERGCIHAEVSDGPHICRQRDKCLHLKASSGRYTQTEGGHRRVPLGAYKIGKVATGEEHKFLINNVQEDPRIHNQAWARELGLTAFAGYQLRPPGGEILGVLALFKSCAIVPEVDAQLDALSNTTAQVISVCLAEEALKESEKKYRHLVETANEGIWAMDADYRTIYVNPRMAEMLGYTPDEMLGRIVTDFMFPEGLADHQTRMAQRQKGFDDNYEQCFQRRDGSELWTLVAVRALIGEAGDFQGSFAMFTDITKRRRAEAWYRTVLSTTRDGYWLLGSQGQILDANDAYCSMVGYSLPELLKMTVFDLEAQHSPAAIEANIRHITLEGSAFFEAQHRTKSGHLVDMEVSVNYLPGDGGRFICLIRDITERKRTENIMQARLRLLEFANTQSVEDLLTATLDEAEALTGSSIGFYHFLEADQKTLSLQSWSTNTLKNMCSAAGKGSHYDISQAGVWTDCIYERHPVIHNDYNSLPHRRGIPEGHAPIIRELVVPIFRGSLIKAIIGIGNKATNYDSRDLDIVAQLGDLSWDIVERELVKNNLAALQRQHEMILQSAGEGILGLDLQGKITFANTAAAKIIGYKQEELTGQDCHELIHHTRSDMSFCPRETCPALAALRTGEICFVSDDVFWSKKNQPVPVEYVTSPIKGNGQVTGAVMLFRDISEHKRLYEQFLQAQKMEAIGTLAGGIAHDFNNMLGVIMGYTEMTLILLPKDSKEHKNLQQVLQASRRAKDLVYQILAFSRKTDQEKKPLQLGLIVKEALKLLRATIPTTIDIKQKISAPQALIIADHTQIHQIIMNLCTNSVQAMREKGDALEIRLEEKYFNQDNLIKYPDLTPGIYIILTVQDNGPGIPPEIIEKIFDPFFTTKGLGEGTGMGLSVVYGIVKSHGGGITVQSQSGTGATFTVLLPKANISDDRVMEVPTPIPHGHGHILIVDDEIVLIDLTKEMLESLGYEVTTSNSSLDAIKIFQAQPDKFNLIITDQTMPCMDGMHLSQEFRRIRPDVPIILCTGFSDKVSEETIGAAGINALLMKPINLRDLGETISRVLDKENQ